MTLPRWHSVAISGRNLRRESAPRLDGSRRLDDASLDVLERQLTVVMGPAGSGKSTLLRILAGLELPDAGEVEHGTVADGGIALVAPERGAGWLPRAMSRLALSERGGASTAVDGPARRFGSIESALASDPAILLADESRGTFWSGRERERIEELRGWVGGGRRTAVLATEDPIAATHGDRVVFLNEGSIVGDLERPDLADVLGAISCHR